MKHYRLFYHYKALIPRGLQILARRGLAHAKRGVHAWHWPIDRDAGRRPEYFTGWPQNKRFALVLRHDVESSIGLPRCADILSIERSFGMRSAFFFVPEDYGVEEWLRRSITDSGCEIGVHGLKHDGKLYDSYEGFKVKAARINRYLKEWDAVGFASPSAHHRFDWLHDLDILYDTSSFDTDPFEPQPDGVRTIFPMVIRNPAGTRPIIELPYTLPQDFTLFVILQEASPTIWQKKLDWIAANGGMVLVNSHPDYMRFHGDARRKYNYPCDFYEELLAYIERTHRGEYWAALPREVAQFWQTLDDSL
jgi:hypothetical protein